MARKRENRSMFDLEQEFVELLHAARQGFDPETGEVTDDELLAKVDAAFEGLGEDIDRKVAGTAFVILRLDREADYVDQEIKRLQARKKKLQGGQTRLKERLREFMTMVGKDKVETPSIAVTLGKASKVVQIVDQERIPSDYMVTPEPPPPRPDKKSLAAALKKGEVPGAILVDGTRSLRIT